MSVIRIFHDTRLTFSLMGGNRRVPINLVGTIIIEMLRKLLTRWNSTCHMMKRAIKTREAIDKAITYVQFYRFLMSSFSIRAYGKKMALIASRLARELVLRRKNFSNTTS